jgi:hypothetical protein
MGSQKLQTRLSRCICAASPVITLDIGCGGCHGRSSAITPPIKLCVVYNHDPPSVCSYTSSDAKLLVVHHQLLERDEFLSEICDRLEHAQQRYKYFYDEHH